MALENFIPEVWHSGILENIKDNLVFSSSGLVNQDYANEVFSSGDTVHINSIGPVSVDTYSKNQGTNIVPEILQDSQMSFQIDQSDYFAFEIDDIDTAQLNPNVRANAMREAAFAMAQKVDTFTRDLINAGVPGGSVGSGNWLADVAGADADKLYEKLVDLSVVLDENNCPEEGRWAVVSPRVYGVLLKDPRFVSFGTDSNRSVISSRAVGEVAGLTIYKTNRSPVDGSGQPIILAGHNWATTFASALEKVEAYRPQSRFSDAIKGLHIYGGKVIRPEMLAKVAVDFS